MKIEKRNRTYVIFDGKNDMWAYKGIKRWVTNNQIDFDFYDAHDIGSIIDQETEESVKQRLCERFSDANTVIVLVGEKTNELSKAPNEFVHWEITVAIELGLPIIAVNLNGSHALDENLCPEALKSKHVMHIEYDSSELSFALETFPHEF